MRGLEEGTAKAASEPGARTEGEYACSEPYALTTGWGRRLRKLDDALRPECGRQGAVLQLTGPQKTKASSWLINYLSEE